MRSYVKHYHSETMDILLDLNQNPAIAPDLRYDIRLPDQPHIQPTLQYLPPYMLPPNASPETANMVMMEGVNRVQLGIVPVMDLYAIRDQIQERLAQQDVRALSALEDSISHPIPPEGVERLASQVNAPENTGYLTADQESAYLARLDANINGLDLNVGKWVDLPPASPHQADLTPRELERQMELSNPQSQHSWLKAHTKTNPVLDGEESEPQALHEASAAGSTKSASRKKAPGKNLAKQVGDRAMEKMMREGFSPSAASGLGEEDDLAPDESTSGRRKKGGEKDPTFRAKGGKGGALKSKRKRVTDEGAAGGAKRMRASEVFE